MGGRGRVGGWKWRRESIKISRSGHVRNVWPSTRLITASARPCQTTTTTTTTTAVTQADHWKTACSHARRWLAKNVTDAFPKKEKKKVTERQVWPFVRAVGARTRDEYRKTYLNTSYTQQTVLIVILTPDSIFYILFKFLGNKSVRLLRVNLQTISRRVFSEALEWKKRNAVFSCSCHLEKNLNDRKENQNPKLDCIIWKLT